MEIGRDRARCFRNVCGLYEMPAPAYIETRALARDGPGGQGVLWSPDAAGMACVMAFPGWHDLGWYTSEELTLGSHSSQDGRYQVRAQSSFIVEQGDAWRSTGRITVASVSTAAARPIY